MMKNWENAIVHQKVSIRDAIQAIDAGALQVALVAGKNLELIGTITDGDIRRGILRGLSLDDPIDLVINKNPETALETDATNEILEKMKQTGMKQIPVLNTMGQIVRVDTLDKLLHPVSRENWVVVMVGGKGKRLRPLTYDCPKPLLKLGGKPVLETILKNFISFGFEKFFLAVNYKSEMIRNYFGDGSQWDIDIQYIEENEPMGTAGALGMLPKPKHPILVMNGDLLTTLNFQQLLDFHIEHRSDATMCVREYEFEVPYGVVTTDQNRIVQIDEKPIHRCFINAGIYVLQPQVIDMIAKQKYLDMTNLFERVSKKKNGSTVFPIREYWIDIGKMEDIDKAKVDYYKIFT